MFFVNGCVWSQEIEQPIKPANLVQKERQSDLISGKFEVSEKTESNDVRGIKETKTYEFIRLKNYKTDVTEKNFQKFFKNKKFEKFSDLEDQIEKFPIKTPVQDKFLKQNGQSNKFHWKPAIIESLYFLGIQHGFRMVQKKTTDELGGPFFRDWGNSVKNLNNWRDGDSFATNYIAHPMQGAVTGRIFINNSDKSKRQEFGNSKEYWESRFKAMAWSAIWSAQFELGPISEASIGNVGLYDRVGPNRMGWVDFVVTPIAGTGVIIGEDMIDKYILKKWLEPGNSRTRIKIYRTFFTPFQSFTNVLRGKVPWKRDNR